MNRTGFIPLLIAWSLSAAGGKLPEPATVVYLFPGQGADHRQFRDLSWPEGFDTVHVRYPVPEKKESLEHYARRFIPLIDRDTPYVLLGVSLGGMICTELADTLDPEKVILISSAKSKDELPGRYTFQTKIPLNRAVPKGLTKGGARILQGIVEPDRSHDRHIFRDMLKKKDAAYLKWTVDMIIRWDRSEHAEGIVHIHGDADHTIPVRNVSCDYTIGEGSHLMVLTRADEISVILEEVLDRGR